MEKQITASKLLEILSKKDSKNISGLELFSDLYTEISGVSFYTGLFCENLKDKEVTPDFYRIFEYKVRNVLTQVSRMVYYVNKLVELPSKENFIYRTHTDIEFDRPGIEVKKFKNSFLGEHTRKILTLEEPRGESIKESFYYFSKDFFYGVDGVINGFTNVVMDGESFYENKITNNNSPYSLPSYDIDSFYYWVYSFINNMFQFYPNMANWVKNNR